ncbi:hypothetical protein [Ramlibacter sp.]|uniref:hypothetical protein n=1 Tax=Ramlibacter sp. TaxID=1917967 RepID=UPI003D0E50AC
MASRTPPRYVPTLTEVVKSPRTSPAVSAEPAPTPTPAPLPSPQPVDHPAFEEEWVHRIMQRVDIALDRRLRDAIASVVLEQTRNLGPLVRAEVEAVVREAVGQALEDELAATRVPPLPPT